MTVDPKKIAQVLRRLGVVYVSPHDLTAMLGIPSRSAGRLLKAMEKQGLAIRYSKNFYKILARG
ncbi:hypothetical protein Pdsh_02140 [Pyrodictium delaneyi]|uniref:Transcriptional regulator n=1 Tax=Pyrodictium delaneyi TaxID=1273541 RepID=A0A211YRG7_9CREN|nr:hypothetical protein Pdsh_02140 [Pyrodictium delaneyi]